MAIVPKRKHSQARRDKRRSNVWKLEAPTLVKCPQCGELKSLAWGGRCLPHFLLNNHRKGV